MRLLLDSHIFLRLDRDPASVAAAQLNSIADLTNEIFVSAVTPWELGIKQSKGKLQLFEPVSQQLLRFGFTELPITFAHAEYAAALPPLHGDPFDRMLIAQAILEDMALVTMDRRLPEYPNVKLFL